jgi:hypothetical protein
MSILITTTTQKNPGPTIRMNCPQCLAKEAPAESFEQIDRVGLFYVIPLFQIRNTFVTCGKCRRQSICKVTTAEIANFSADDLSDYLVRRVPLVCQFLAVASVLLSVAPFAGPLLGIVAVLANWRTIGWPKTVSRVGLGMSIAFSIILVIVILVHGPG